jgi:3-deoxy-D-manno-octulosonate 8-phosphate phosphatase (KDO 8-P phosphatase)
VANIPKSVLIAAAKIKLVLLDVDGVMTDGKLYYGNSGEEIKAFNIRDGLGIKLLQQGGIQVGIITGRISELLQRRACELVMEPIIQGREDKLCALLELLQSTTVTLEEIAFMGDDLPDLSVITNVGLGVAVADASAILIAKSDWQTSKIGGDGAVRELAEMILVAQGKWDDIESSYQ